MVQCNKCEKEVSFYCMEAIVERHIKPLCDPCYKKMVPITSKDEQRIHSEFTKCVKDKRVYGNFDNAIVNIVCEWICTHPNSGLKEFICEQLMSND